MPIGPNISSSSNLRFYFPRKVREYVFGAQPEDEVLGEERTIGWIINDELMMSWW